MRGLNCPDCGTDEYVPEFEIDGLYVCAKCGKKLGYYCSGCDRVYMENRLGKHGDVWECKLCGKIQWGYTEYMRGEGR